MRSGKSIRKALACLLCGVMGVTMSACEKPSNEGNNNNSNTTVSILPDYDSKEGELFTEIAGWVMPKTFDAESVGYIKDSGISVLQFVSAGASTRNISLTSPTAEDETILNICEQNGLKALVHIPSKDDTLIEKVSNVSRFGAVMGVCFDEPNKEQIDKIASRVSAFNAKAGNKTLFTNLYPSFAPTVATAFAGDYKAYLEYYCNNVLNKLSAGEKWLSADRYPLTYDGKGQPCLDTGWLADVEAVALTARQYADVKTNFFIQTMPYSRNGTQVGSRDRVPSYEDVRLQEYALVSFGYDMISCFCYATPVVGTEFTEEQLAMVDREGKRTSVYYAVQKANKEILSFDHVIKQFSWKGVFTNDAGKTTIDKERSKNASFSNLTERMSLKAIDCLESVTSSADTLFGYFTDAEENAGFTVVNYNDSSAKLTDTVTLHFASGYKFNKALVYAGGEKKITEFEGDALTLTLGVGEGVFVIPYAE